MHRHRLWLALALAALVSGCAAPGLERRPALGAVEVPAAWSAGGAAEGAASPAPAGAVAGGWLADLDDAQLSGLVDEAVGANFDLRGALARVQAARAQAVIAGASLLPTVDAEGRAARQGSPIGGGARRTANTFDASLGVVWEADLWGRLADGARAAALEARASARDYEAARLSLAASVARAWYAAIEAVAQVDLADQTASNFAENLEIVQEGFQRGLNSALDVRLERANLANARSRLQARRVDRDRALRTLEVLLGRYPGAVLALPSALPALTSAVPAGIPAALLSRRPDVRSAELGLAATNARLAAAAKNRLPALRLTGAGGLSSTELGQLLDLDALLWSLVTNLSAPIYAAGRLEAERVLAAARADEALARYAQAVLTAFREVESALTAEELLAAQEAALRVAAEESDEAAALALERYRSGLVEIITWLEARRRAFDTRSALIALSNQRLQNRIALHLALGGGFAPGEPGASREPEPSARASGPPAGQR